MFFFASNVIFLKEGLLIVKIIYTKMENIKKTNSKGNIIQGFGGVLIIVAGIITLLGMTDIIKVESFLYEDGRRFLALIGFGLLLIPIYASRIIKKTFLLLLFLSTSLTTFSQDYTKQIEAFSNSFKKKDVSFISEYISEDLKFDPVPAKNTLVILKNIVTNLPKLNGINIIESVSGKAKVNYDFELLGKSESYIFFDKKGKITKIEFIENLIKQEMAQRQQLQQSVKMPSPNKLDIPNNFKLTIIKAKDGVTVYGNLYEVDAAKSTILLCHQAGYNKYEYADIAPRLNKMGYNVLAIDQRSGGTFANKNNETFEKAKKEGRTNLGFVDAEKDILAAVDYLHKKYRKKIILWGSSYSSSLVLFVAQQSSKVSAVISFSPGNYFGDKKESLETILPKINQPIFITSSKEEAKTIKNLYSKNKLKTNQVHFVPNSDGFHGSRALWLGQKGSEEYWSALHTFLNTIK